MSVIDILYIYNIFGGDVMEHLKEHTCCFFGHRKITASDELKGELCKEIEKLIVNEGVDTFLFGSRSQFDDLCYDVVSKLKEKYPHIKRVYARAGYADIDRGYTNYLLTYYEDTYYSEKIRGAGRASYVQRNREMINRSKFCVIYYDENYLPPTKEGGHQAKSGTALAYVFAAMKGKRIINIYNSFKI